MQKQVAQDLLKVKSIGDTSIIMIDMLPTVQSLFVPIKATGTGLAIDITTLVGNTTAISDKADIDSYNSIMGTLYSYMEGYVLEQATGIESVSTISILNTSMELGLEIYTIDSSNIDTINELNINSATKKAIQNYVEAGNTVTVPESDITINDWTGTGYIVMSEDGLPSAHMISGGLAGGAVTEYSWLSDLLAFIMVALIIVTAFLVLCIAFANPTPFLGLTVISFVLSIIATAIAYAVYIENGNCRGTGDRTKCTRQKYRFKY